MLPRYPAVKGSLGPEIRCWTRGEVSAILLGRWCVRRWDGLLYTPKPINTPQATRNRRLPIDHLSKEPLAWVFDR